MDTCRCAVRPAPMQFHCCLLYSGHQLVTPSCLSGAGTRPHAAHAHQNKMAAEAVSAPPSPSAAFVASCPAGKLDPLGLQPVPKVQHTPSSLRPASGSSSRSLTGNKPSALDKHLRHVVLLQRGNRQQAQQHAAVTQHKQQRRQRFADWGHRLRDAILHRGGGNNSVAAAAQTRELQETDATQQQALRSTLPAVLDPDTLRPTTQLHAGQGSGNATGNESAHKQQQQQLQGHQDDGMPAHSAASTAAGCKAVAAKPAGGAAGEEGGCSQQLDVDAFLDGLLQTAAAAAPAPASHPAAAAAPGASSSGSAHGNHNSLQEQPQKAALSLSTAPSSSSKVRAKLPAWALSEQQTAAAAAAQAEAEEAGLLQFAEGLGDRSDLLQGLLHDLGDDELAAAFKELEVAEAAAAEGQPGADKAWQASFVAALNAATMRGLAGGNSLGAAAAAAGSQQGDRQSTVSSASALRRAEASAARRQHLLQKLHSLTGTTLAAADGSQGSPSQAGGGGSAAGGSIAGSAASGSMLGRHAEEGSASGSGWDGSTVVSSAAQDVGRLVAAIKHLEAGEVLGEWAPELRGVHSAASVRAMLVKLQEQQPQAQASNSGGA